MRRTLNLLGISVLALLAVGFALIASASEANGIRLHNNPYYFIVHQAYWLVPAAIALLFMVFFDYHRWRRHAWLMIAVYIITCLLLCAVFGFREINGSRRWIIMGPIRLQPSEFAKIVVILATGAFLDRFGPRIELFWKGALPAVGIIAILAGLPVFEPDYGSAMVIGFTGFLLLFVAGMKIWHFAILGGLCLLGGVAFVATNPNRMRRILAWLPEDAALQVADYFNLQLDEKAKNAIHQLKQSLIAIQRGGYTGVGFNKSMQKQYYLPEAHTDFIFAIGAEEWGLVFSLVLLALFVAIFICGIRISLKAPDRLGRLYAYGATFLIFYQAVFNILVVTGLAPTKGLALPFISYGGTNLVTALAAVGLLFNVGRQIELQNRRQKSKISPVFSTQGG